MSITQLASFNPRQLKHLNLRQINALPNALWRSLNLSQTRALISGASRSFDTPKRRFADWSKQTTALSENPKLWLSNGLNQAKRPLVENELLFLNNPLLDPQLSLPLLG